MQHHLGHAAGEEHLHGRVVARAVGQRVDEARHAAADLRPVARGGPRQPCGVGNRRNVQQKIRGSAERGVRDHRVAERRCR